VFLRIAAAGLVEEGAVADTDAVTTEFDDVLTVCLR